MNRFQTATAALLLLGAPAALASVPALDDAPAAAQTEAKNLDVFVLKASGGA